MQRNRSPAPAPVPRGSADWTHVFGFRWNPVRFWGLTDTGSNLDACQCLLTLSAPQCHVCKGGIQIPASQDGCGHVLFHLIKKPQAGEGWPHEGLLCFPASGPRDQPELTPASLAASDPNGLRSLSLRKCLEFPELITV